ncbi:hypothetical protein Ctob_002497 [Chrysochromulina tobinii]|uniref:EF-hand domain-containing protein n=1 Tax=Chrysochromulina tobinii TaxID=1460289 RepID=A0A0M0JJF4_9EUKA|nr:hypothetical protein Ctob_002497 [Chrysochromulina tobinii]|eukprot:KOO26610.1 hypothetical protein Ctob_002497 [Chrysochromulina sp. CCMP291]
MPPIWAKSPKNLGALTSETLRNFFRFSGGMTVIQHFRGIDHDHDGILTLEDFIIGVRSIGFENATEEECTSVFKWLDDDGSGAVPYQELDKKLREHSTSPQQPASINRVLAFARLKTNGNLMDAKKGKGWMDRARTKVGRRKFEELMRSQGIDGDETLNSVEAFTKRQTLRKNRLVTEMLTMFWAVALSVAKHRPHGRPNAVDLSFDDYLITYKQIYRKLVGEDDYDEAEAEDSALEEFFRDAGGMGFMSQHAFVGGIFEVADLYVESLEAEDYANFLNDLLMEIAPAIAKASGIPPIDLKRDKEALLRVASDAEQAEDPRIDQYRRAISSPQALKAYVEGPRTNHHRRSEILGEVIMNEDRRRDVYTPYIGPDDMIEVEHQGRGFDVPVTSGYDGDLAIASVSSGPRAKYAVAQPAEQDRVHDVVQHPSSSFLNLNGHI